MKVRPSSCGFTIVELMVTLAMTAIVVAAAYGIFSAQTKRRAVEQESMEMQQSARMALGMMARDLSMVGYWGWACDKGCTCDKSLRECLKEEGTDIEVTLRYNENNEMLKKFKKSDTTDFITDAIFGWNNLENDDDRTNFDGNEDTKIKPGTDALLVFYVDGSIPVEVDQNMNGNTDDIHVADATGLTKRDVMLIADSTHASIFQITNNPVNNSPLQHGTGAANTPGNSTKDLGNAYAENSFLFPFRVKCYWVSDPDNASDPHGGNQLRVSTLQGGDEILARDVEDLQLLYKEDTDGDGKPDTDWLSATGVSDWSQVVLAKIWLLMKSAKTEKDYSDSKTYQFADGSQHPDPDHAEDARYHRMVFERTVALRNRTIE